MAFDVLAIAKAMFDAAFPILKQDAPQIGTFAQEEFKKLAQQIATIESELASGAISNEEAKILLDMQKSAARVVLLTAKGLGMLTAEKALNAALGAAKTALEATGVLSFL